MRAIQQAIQHPLGINVFGSAILRVSPDIVSITFAVGNTAQHPRDAFQTTRERVRRVRAYLNEAPIEDASTSRIVLTEKHQFISGGQKFLGFEASVGFNILVTELDRVEDIIAGLVDAGVNKISDVAYQTTQLKSFRAKARQRAVQAAIEKAEVYCQEAGVSLGPLRHLEDINPQTLRGHEGHGRIREDQIDDEGPIQAFDPGSITVKGAVMMAFEIVNPPPEG
jgi:uncharacterized protein YggE